MPPTQQSRKHPPPTISRTALISAQIVHQIAHRIGARIVATARVPKDQGPRKGDANRPRRDDNRNGRREERRSPQMITAAPPKSATGDSSSPFAALAALKAQMEKRSEGSGST